MIVDDHPAVRLAIRLLLANEGFDVVAETGDGAEALFLAERLRPALMVLDLGLDTVDGVAVIDEVIGQGLPMKIVVFTGLASLRLEECCRQHGAHGFVSKHSEMAELVYAIKAVRADDYLPAAGQDAKGRELLNQQYERLESLSAREFKLMQCVIRGLGSKEIAEHLGLTLKTVSTYKARLYSKLEVNSLDELRTLARHTGLL
ncbi:response regulator transcription factor [Pseudomonas sp. BW16M2]|nr:response regulator transcription factor [Pseudomonas sp. BW16M2]